MHSSAVFSDRWHLKALLAIHLLAFLWLGFFLTEVGFDFWRSVDQAVFYALNGSIAGGGNWAQFWAYANVRIADLIPLLIILATLTFPSMGIKADRLQQAFIGFFLLLILMYLVRESVHELTRTFGMSSNSPSLTLEPAYRFSQMFPDIPAKDHAGHSFPGDHATVLLTWAGFIILNARSWLSLSALLLAMLFMLPRLVGGAHWLSDNLIGGMFAALITLSWAFCTPLMHTLTTRFHRLLCPLLRLLQKIPGVNQLPILKQESH